MRILFCFAICLVGCRTERPEDAVLAVYKQMEKAAQTGDANAYIGMWSRESAGEAEKMRPVVRPRPDLHYTASKVYIQGNDAVLLGQYGKDEFLSMRFVKEDGRWKIKDQAFNNTAYPAESVYAMLPPAAGAFARAGAPWQRAAPALDAASAARQGFQVRAAYDESFLYIRIESPAPLPAPGAPAEKPSIGVPVMKVGVAGVGEFVLRATANVGDYATFDKSGHANSHRQYAAYWLMLEHAGQMVFEVWAGLDPTPLVQVAGNFFDVRVPLRSMGVTDASHTKITVGDAQWPKSVIFSVDAQPFR